MSSVDAQSKEEKFLKSSVRPSVKLTLRRAVKAPLVTITRKSTYPAGRSVGFVFKKLADGRLVIATAAHVFHPENNPAAYAIESLDGKEFQVDEMFSGHSHDVAFLIVRSIPGFAPLSFETPRRETVLPKTLYTLRNILGSGQRTYLAIQQGDLQVLDIVVMTPPWEIALEGLQKPLLFPTPTPEGWEKIGRLSSEGWSRLSYMPLYSRPGFSGTPIWDDLWNLYGMGVRGTATSSNDNPEQELCAYYPRSFLDTLWSEFYSE